MMDNTHKNFKRILAIFLSVVMLFMQLPMGIFATELPEEDPSASVTPVEPEEPATPTGTLVLGSSVTVEAETLYAFTPEESNIYCFFSKSGSEHCDPKIRLLDANKKELAQDDDGGGNLNFALYYELTAGTTYYVEVSAYNNSYPYTLTVGLSDIEKIEIVSIPTFEAIKNDATYGSWASVYQEEIVDRYFVYRPYEALYEVVIEVTYKDGTTEEVAFFDEDEEYTGINMEWDFYNNPWDVGTDNHYYVTYNGAKALASATLLASPVASMELVDIDLPEIIEHDESQGYWTNYYQSIELEEPYFSYQIDPTSIKLAVTYTDGTTEQVSYLNEKDESTGIRVYSDQYQTPWTVGENEFEIWYKGFCITSTATVVETPVESIRVLSGGEFEYDEYNENYGYWMGANQENFYYYLEPLRQDIVLEVTYKDGAVENIAAGNNYTVTFSDNQNNTPWTPGGNNEVTISYKGVTTTINATVKPGIVESISVDNVTVTEGTHGSLHENQSGNGSDFWYHYELFAGNITVTLTDGTTVQGSQYEIYEQLGLNITLRAEQIQNDNNPWGVGEHKIIASVSGKKAEFLYIIEESDIASVSVENVTIEEMTNGSWYEGGYWDDMGHWVPGDEWFCYEPGRLMQLTVTFKDDSIFTGSFQEFVEAYDYYPETFTNQRHNNQWVVGETYTATVFLGGKTAEFSVTIEESNIQSIEVIDTQGFKFYENDTSCGEWRDDYFHYSVWYLVRNITIRVTYKDGTTEDIPYYNEFGDHNSDISYFDNQEETPWTVGGENLLTVTYCGAKTTISAPVEGSPIASIYVENLTFTQNTHGNWNEMGYHDENGNWVSTGMYFYYHCEPAFVTITYKDGTVISGTPWEIQEQTGASMSFAAQQSSDNPWGPGDYTATVSFMGFTSEYTVTIEQSNIVSISMPDVTYVEGTNGWLQEEGDGYGNILGYYYHYNVSAGEITVTYRDGSTFTGTVEELANLTGSWPSFSSSQCYATPWGVGTHTVEVSYMGATTTYNITITPSNVERIEVAPLTYVEYTCGHWREYHDENGYHEYYYYNITPGTVTVYFTDGTSITGDPDQIINQTGYYMSYYSDQDYNNQWGLGTHTVTVYFMGKTVEMAVTIEASPIANIVVDNLTITQYSGGWWNDNGYHDEDGNWVVTEGQYYYYDYTPQNITITYNDGTVISGTREEIGNQTGYWPEYSASQNAENPWGLGDHTATLTFMGETVEYTVTIEESNIASVTADNITIVEGTQGWLNDYQDENGNHKCYFYYEINPGKITVTYRDGSSITGTSDEIGAQTGYWPEVNINQGSDNQWGVGTHTVTVSYMGTTGTFDVIITPSPVESISVGAVTHIENTNGEWRYEYVDGEGELQFYYYYVRPEQITVNYTDGTSFTGTPDELGMATDYYISVSTNQGYDNQWGIGTHTATVYYMGKTAELTVNIEASPIQSITAESVTIEEGTKLSWYTVYGDDTYYYNYYAVPQKITITYTDGTPDWTGTYDELYKLLDGELSFSTDQSENNQWGVGAHTAEIHCLGTSVAYDVTITETQIETITVMPVIAIAGEDCWLQTQYYDPQQCIWVYAEWYQYNSNPEMITVTFKDGTVFAGTYEDFRSLGYGHRINDNQSYHNQWGVGVHSVNFTCPGSSVSYNVEIVEEIDTENFSYCVLSDGTAILTGYYGSTEHVVIPETVDGYTVSVIATYILTYTNMKTLTIPATVKRIEKSAFHDNYYLTTVRLYAGIEMIGESAFENCNNLQNVVYIGTEEEAESLAIFNYNNPIKNATWHYTTECTEHVYDDVCDTTCNNCFAQREPEHAFEWVIDYAGDCLNDGWKHEACSLCGETRNTNTIIPARGSHGETEVRDAREATCFSYGYTGNIICVDCGCLVEYGTDIEPTGIHLNTELLGAEEPTCGQPGYTGDVYCHDCYNYIEYGHSVEPTGQHENTELINESEATCTQDGYTGDLYCNDCNTTIEHGEIIYVTDHQPSDERVNVSAPTCGTNGYSGDLVCTVCGTITEYGLIIYATGNHQNTILTNVRDASCEQTGYTGDLFCYDCRTTVEYGHEIPMKDHENTELRGQKDASCGQPGYTGDLWCNDCNTMIEEGEEILSSDDHLNTYLDGEVEATCGQPGYTGDLWCSDCNTLIEKGETIPATGEHGAFYVEGNMEATCSEPGYTGDVVCGYCHTTTQTGQVIAATGRHEYDNGYDTDCNVCGAVREVQLTPPTLSLVGGTAYQGDTIRVDVRIDGNTGFAALQFGILYDNTYLTLKDVETQMDGFFVTFDKSILFDSISNYTSDGVIATLVFEVAENAPVGKYNLQLRFMSGSNEDFEEVVMSDSATTIYVESAVAGDANGDGKVDTRDLTMIRRYLASMDPVTMTSEISVKKGADTNNDGVIDALDLAYIRQYLVSIPAV